MGPSSNPKRWITTLQQALEPMECVCSGSLFTRTRVCGKPNCRCATDPDARHGPYFTWAHRDRDRVIHHILTRNQAQLVRTAILNYRAIRRIIARWDRDSTTVILAQKTPKS